VVTLGWPIHLLAKAPCGWNYGAMPSASCVHRLKGHRQNFNSLSKMLRVFKIKISVFQVRTLAKRQKNSLPEFCYGFNKALRFFIRPLI
jgi:hypothetical protein